ncbi:uncharacterized protein [Primulina eburnea]|uniref:uncharacterized protein n=1 Tax=Primulina eburnea TaxID=1245227 RepID=UPI003C6C7EED
MQAHLAAQDDDMWFVNTDGPMKIMKVNIAVETTGGAPQMIEKHRSEWTAEDKKKANLENVAKDILYKTLDKNMFAKIKTCTTAKEIWEKLTQLCEGNDQTKENKLTVAIQKFDNAKMKPGETLAEFDERFSNIIIELISLGKEYSNRENALKVMRALPREWDVKTIAVTPRKFEECNRPKKDEKKQENRRQFKDNKKFIKKKNQRVLIAEEDKGKWAEIESEKSSSEASSSESEDETHKEVNSLKVKLSLLAAENDDLRRLFHATLKENKRLMNIVNTWNKSSASLNRMNEMQKPAGDITGLGYNINDCSTSEASTQPLLEKDSLRSIKFVRSSSEYEHDKPEVQGQTQPVTMAQLDITQEPDPTITTVADQFKRDVGNIVLTGYRSKNIYRVEWNDERLNASTCFIALNGNKNFLWHKRLNHLNFKSIATISKLKMVSGLPNVDFAKDKVCNACQLGKQVRSTFKSKGINSSTRCLELLHMDLFGPIPVISLGGKKYTLVVIDDFSRFTWVLFLSSKDQTADQLIKLLKGLQNEKKEEVDRIRSDRGTEFLNKYLSSYLEDHGIKHEL